MAASKHAMPAFSAYRVEVVVLGMALFAEPCTFVGAPGTSFTVSSTRTLGSLSLSVCNSNHRKTLISVRIIEPGNSMMREYHIDNLASLNESDSAGGTTNIVAVYLSAI